jgi:hypothetical protein
MRTPSCSQVDRNRSPKIYTHSTTQDLYSLLSVFLLCHVCVCVSVFRSPQLFIRPQAPLPGSEHPAVAAACANIPVVDTAEVLPVMPPAVGILLDYFVRRPKVGGVNGVGATTAAIDERPDSIDMRFLAPPLSALANGRPGLTWGSRALLVEAQQRDARIGAGRSSTAASQPPVVGSTAKATTGAPLPPNVEAPRQGALSSREADTIVLHWLARVLDGWPPLQGRALPTLPGVDLVCVLEACRRVAAHVVVDIPADVPSWTRARQAE